MIKAATKNSTDMFQQAVESFESALCVGMRLQEDSAERYMDVLRDIGSPTEWQGGATSQLSKAIAATQENIARSIQFIGENAQKVAQAIHSMNASAEQTVSLMEKALRMQCSNTEMGEEDGYFWTYSLNAMRSNAEILQQANARVMETWAELAKDVLHRIETMQAEVCRATNDSVSPK